MGRIINLKTLTTAVSNIPANLWQGSARTKWVAGTYGAGDIVYYDAVFPNKVYTSLVGGNTAIPGTDDTKWQDNGGTDRHAMFDEFLNTQSFYATSFEVEVSANNCDKACFFELDCETIDFELWDNGSSSVVQSGTIDLADGLGCYKKDIIQTLYIYPDSTLIATFNKTGVAKCGFMAIGQSRFIGDFKWGFNAGFTDYSVVSEDAFGRAELIQGNYSKNLKAEALPSLSALDNIYELLTNIRGIRSILDANSDNTDMEVLRLYGFPASWNLSIAEYNLALLELDYEGLI